MPLRLGPTAFTPVCKGFVQGCLLVMQRVPCSDVSSTLDQMLYLEQVQKGRDGSADTGCRESYNQLPTCPCLV
jgi:hypothetical protein